MCGINSLSFYICLLYYTKDKPKPNMAKKISNKYILSQINRD